MSASLAIGARRPTSLLIAALGGQGGGVLAGWIGHAARADGLLVQSTSTPGVSQRTGATTYYVEMAPKPPDGRPAPVLGLAPIPGRVDVVVCAELLEAGRMLERGMCTPARTLVIASTHRAYTTHEKMSGSDGRFDSDRVVEAVRALSRQSVLFDMEAVRLRHRAAISAVLFGALAGSGSVPLSRTACEDAIRAAAIGIDSSLAAFADAFAQANGQPSPTEHSHGSDARLPSIPEDLAARAGSLPAHVRQTVLAGVARLLAYQDARYAQLYVTRVERLVRAAGPVTHDAVDEAARQLALWMGYGDLIAVAAAKSRAARFARIRREAGAKPEDVVRVHDFFCPGVGEIAAVLPRPVGAWVERTFASSQAMPSHRRITLQTSSLAGALAMRMLAACRPLRPRSLRHAREQAAIAGWLTLLERTLGDAARSPALVSELAGLPRLLKGYGDTHAAGLEAFRERIEAFRRATDIVRTAPSAAVPAPRSAAASSRA